MPSSQAGGPEHIYERGSRAAHAQQESSNGNAHHFTPAIAVHGKAADKQRLSAAWTLRSDIQTPSTLKRDEILKREREKICHHRRSYISDTTDVWDFSLGGCQGQQHPATYCVSKSRRSRGSVTRNPKWPGCPDTAQNGQDWHIIG
jgi:hypothetical protein